MSLRLPRFRLRTILIAIALIGLVLTRCEYHGPEGLSQIQIHLHDQRILVFSYASRDYVKEQGVTSGRAAIQYYSPSDMHQWSFLKDY